MVATFKYLYTMAIIKHIATQILLFSFFFVLLVVFFFLDIDPTKCAYPDHDARRLNTGLRIRNDLFRIRIRIRIYFFYIPDPDPDPDPTRVFKLIKIT